MTKKIVVVVMAVLFAVGVVMLAFVKYQPSRESAGETGFVLQPSSLPKVVASVNSVDIDRKTFIRVINAIKAQFRSRGETFSREKFDSLKQKVIKNITNTEVLYQAAAARNLSVDMETVEREYEGLKAQYESEELFKADLKRKQFTPAKVKDEIRKSYMITKLLSEDVFSRIKVTEENARERYRKNIKEYESPPMVKARHILLNLAPDADGETVRKAEDRMKEVVEKLERGANFEKLARDYSEGPSAVRGGDLGYFPRGAMVKEFDDVAFSLRAGDTGTVVRTRFGLHLVETTGFKGKEVKAFEKVKEKIMLDLEIEERNRRLDAYISGLRKKSDITTFL